MAWYKYSTNLTLRTNDEFDKIYDPGTIAGWSGIYRCEGCGREVVHTIGKPLPPQNHHQHTYGQGTIRWKLIVTDAPDSFLGKVIGWNCRAGAYEQGNRSR